MSDPQQPIPQPDPIPQPAPQPAPEPAPPAPQSYSNLKDPSVHWFRPRHVSERPLEAHVVKIGMAMDGMKHE